MSVSLTPPMFLQFFVPGTNQPAVGSQLFTYIAGTSTKQATWTDSTQITQSANPIIADANGVMIFWLDPSLLYKFVWAAKGDTDPPSSPIYSVDNISGIITSAVLTQAFIGSILYPRTAAEIAAGVTPVNFSYAPNNVKRYGAIGNGSTDDTAAIRVALNYAGANGLTSLFFPEGNYKITSTLVIPGENITLYGEGVWASTITCAITGSAAPSLFTWTANAGGTQAQFLQVQGLRFSGNSLTGASGNGNCFSLIGVLAVTFASFATFRDCSFLGFEGTGQDHNGSSIAAASIYVYFGNVLKIENCLFETFAIGVFVDGATGASHTAKVNVSACTFETGSVVGIQANFCDQLLVNDQTVFNNLASGIALTEVGETATIDDCRFKLMTTGAAILAVSASIIDQLNITNCYFYNAFQASPVPVLDIGTNVRGCLISGCELLFDNTVVNALGIVIQNPSGFLGGTFTILANRWTLGGAATVTSCILTNNGTNAISSLLIAGNYFGQPAPTGLAQIITTAVSLAGAGGVVSPSVINNCFAMGTPGVITTAISVGAGVTGALLLNNSYIGGAVTTPVSDSGTKTIRIEAGDSNIPSVGFFGHAVVSTRPTVTGAKAGNAALTSLLTTLAQFGLITDSTT